MNHDEMKDMTIKGLPYLRKTIDQIENSLNSGNILLEKFAIEVVQAINSSVSNYFESIQSSIQSINESR